MYLLDGGLGTTLEDVFGKDTSGPLWSASFIDKEPDIIVEAHKAFLKAGSSVILTSTYQCAFETFDRAGYSKADAINIMRKSVRLAARAKTDCHKDGSEVQIDIALSLGPYGATLSPPQEFDGFYPPPYGPRAYTLDGQNVNSFEDIGDERTSIIALADFHYERLKVFADNAEDGVWPLIDMIAFETVPLRREMLAIRVAMARLKLHLTSQGLPYKPWWISTVWPGGNCPEQPKPGGSHLDPHSIAHALLFDHGPVEHDGVVAEMALPDGLGVNCTHIVDLGVLAILRETVSVMGLDKKLFLVVYPNGGGLYDIHDHRWIPEEEASKEKTKMPLAKWAEHTGLIALIERNSGVWSQVIVGGCCKTTPDHIALLGEYIK